MKRYAIIVAGGVGRRAGSELPKQFVRLLGIPMLWWSVRAFHDYDPETGIIIVLHPDFIQDFETLVLAHLPEADRKIPFKLVAGGRDRLESVANGLASIPLEERSESLVAVHDAARPMLSTSMVGRAWEKGLSAGASVPVVPVTDSLRQVDATSSHAVDRSAFRAVQTPQVFRSSLLVDAYSKIGDLRSCMTDDASVAEAAGYSVALFEGDPANIKVTNPIDFKIAALLLENRSR